MPEAWALKRGNTDRNCEQLNGSIAQSVAHRVFFRTQLN